MEPHTEQRLRDPAPLAQTATSVPEAGRPAEADAPVLALHGLAHRTSGCPAPTQLRRTPVVEALQRHTGSTVIRREVKHSQAESALSNIMTDHKQEAWYAEHWKSGTVKRIAHEVADRADTSKDNLKSRLLSDDTVAEVVRPHRLQHDPAAGPDMEQAAGEDRVAGLQGPALASALQTVWSTYQSLLFYHVSEAAEKIRAGGLDPMFGGNKEGKANTDSLAGRKDHNVANSAGKVFVTRKWSEVKAYQSTGGDLVRVLIPPTLQAQLKVDPDSQFGLYLQDVIKETPEGGSYNTVLLKGMERPSGRLGPEAYYILTAAITDPEVRDLLPELYEHLVKKQLFTVGKEEEITDLTLPMYRPLTV